MESWKWKKEWGKTFFDEIASLSKEKFNPKCSDELKCIELENIDPEVGQINGWVSSREQISTKNIFTKGNVLSGKLRPYLKKYRFATFDGVCSSEIWVLQANAEQSLKNIYSTLSNQMNL